ncbi:hypothetical protein N665_0100s0024 [Sinapis alba]|nr:hypothetical protein N665_0100s0024 [Sinapis alba]
MRDGFGTCLKKMKLLGNRMDVVEKKLGITGKESSSHDLQQTTSSLPKRRLEHGSESVNGAKARHDEKPSSSKALSVEAKEKEVKEGKEKELKEKELKEKANKGLEKVLAKAKEAKANEAKAKEAKANEAKTNEAKAKEAKAKEKEAKAKEKEAKAKEKKAKAKESEAKEKEEKEAKEKEEKETKEKEAKEKEEKEAKLAAEAWLGEAKLEEEAKAKEAADKAKEPDESAVEASVVLMDKDEDTVSDGNSTAKLIIPNTKVGHGYDPFALPDKQLTKALMDHVKKDPLLDKSSWTTSQKTFQKTYGQVFYWDDFTEDLPHMDAYINVLRLRQRNNPNHFRSERICFLDHLFSRMWRDKYGEFKSSVPDHNGLGRRLLGGSWDLYAGIVPTFCATNKTWGVDIDEIYAYVNFQNDHWIAIWISIPMRHIVVWDSVVKHISKAELDEIMEPFLTMVPYLLVECASTDEKRIKYSLEPFTYERPTVGVPQCIASDCGVYALKYMECHALGYTSFPPAFCEKNVKQIREKMAHDIFHETPGFEGIEDETSYFNDLDMYG